MKTQSKLVLVALVLAVHFHAAAATHYVAPDSPGPVAPYTDWSTAATNIQDAINAAVDGDTVLVTNGVYASGGKSMDGVITNRVAVNKAILVQSVNGPGATVIQGAWEAMFTNGPGAVRCVWLTNNATLSGFTLRGGATRPYMGFLAPASMGGGVWGSSNNATVFNCVIVSNCAAVYGGGAFGVTLNHCRLTANRSVGRDSYYDPSIGLGGGAYFCKLENCSVTDNSAGASGGGAAASSSKNCTFTGNRAIYHGNGAYWGTHINGTFTGNYGSPGGSAVTAATLTNCIVWGNSRSASQTANYYSNCTLSYCNTTPLPSGPGNISIDPQFLSDGVHLAETSPCRAAGTTNGLSGTDMDGQAWANPPAIGCDEWQAAPVIAVQPRFSPGLKRGTLNFDILAAGSAPFSFNWSKDGTPIQNDSHYSSADTAGLVVNEFGPADAGQFQVVVSNTFGVVTSQAVRVVVHCANAAGTNPQPPYTNWATAATTIQDAIESAQPGEIVLVTNGVYATGGKVMAGDLTNRVVLDKALTVMSVNGAAATTIQGVWDPAATNGPLAVRCAALTDGAVLSGFTLRDGATRAFTAPIAWAMMGGGVWGSSSKATVFNCVIVSNCAAVYGGGAYGVTLNHCRLTANQSVGRSPSSAFIIGLGGGAYLCNLENCSVTDNFAMDSGGGSASSDSTSCSFTGNSTLSGSGSGAYQGNHINGTFTGNKATSKGVIATATLANCIVWGNLPLGSGATNYYHDCTLSYCNTAPLPSGPGNISVDPQFLSDGVHLAETSPCRAAGTANGFPGTDMDGQAWANPPAIGCDEWQPEPAFAVQPWLNAGLKRGTLTFGLLAAGSSPFSFYWSKDGTPIQNDSHYSSADTAGLMVNQFGPADAGQYQVIVSNAFGMATSDVVRVVIHCVDAAGTNPQPPHTNWATAATTIQDAIDAAQSGDIVLVTNGVYATGGKVLAGNLTNRVALDKALTVVSVNGAAVTTIQGAWDPATTNGPLAVRCAALADGAVLSGFTLCNGATRSTGAWSLTGGGGIWCSSANGVAYNCVVSNNAAISGGGAEQGTLNNCLVIRNWAKMYSGGCNNARITNCLVVENYCAGIGGGILSGIVRNSVVRYNFGANSLLENNSSFGMGWNYDFAYSCTYPNWGPGGGGVEVLYVDPMLLDSSHLSAASPCRGAGSSLTATGTDLDGDAWANPPSIGCDEVVESALIGPLEVTLQAAQTNTLAGFSHPLWFTGRFTGRASRLAWSFGDGPVVTNASYITSHVWTNAGNYTVTFTVFNNDHPDGVSTNLNVFITPIEPPVLASPTLASNGLQFSITLQPNVSYTAQYATNLAPPVTWQWLTSFSSSTGGVRTITDPALTNTARFYRVWAY